MRRFIKVWSDLVMQANSSMRFEINAVRLLCLVFLLAFSSVAGAQTAEPWPDANRLFRSDPHWLGADGAFSVDLGKNRVLWLFGDTYFAAEPDVTTRQEASFIRNSAAIETGYDPSHAAIQFYEGSDDDHVAAFAASPEPGTWLWPLQGIRLGNRLLLFYQRIAKNPTPGSLGFQLVGYNAFMVDNPDADPSQWQLAPLDAPDIHGTLQIGSAVLSDGGYVYAFASDSADHNGYLLRWPQSAAAQGDLSSPQWWSGAAGWQADEDGKQAVILHAGPGFSVQRDPAGGFVEVNSAGIGATTIVWRHAARPEGPWSAPAVLYRPPESDLPFAFVYAAKSHPELTGADFVITYVPNLFGGRSRSDLNLYVPKFVKVNGLGADPGSGH